MKAYRIARTMFCDGSGEGAKRFGGRWNSAGIPALYASNSVASGLLERLTVDPELFAAERYVVYSVQEFTMPENLIFFPELNRLPTGWDSLPAGKASQRYGDELLAKGVVSFAVPSVVDRTSVNYVINPLAADFRKIVWKVYPLKLDQRIVR
ncbi:MAG: RES family NAD+ phosphorylase [Cyclobacteriaceae bacterium]|nr:RES family NAD+ phosphorylase [Cyclobacteriaceae bacterium]